LSPYSAFMGLFINASRKLALALIDTSAPFHKLYLSPDGVTVLQERSSWHFYVLRGQVNSIPTRLVQGARALRIYDLPCEATSDLRNPSILGVFSSQGLPYTPTLLRPSFPISLPTSQIRKKPCGRTINCMVPLAPLLAPTKRVKSSASPRF
jgi:hypothetical protein